jgi:hypothetical protein
VFALAYVNAITLAEVGIGFVMYDFAKLREHGTAEMEETESQSHASSRLFNLLNPR